MTRTPPRSSTTWDSHPGRPPRYRTSLPLLTPEYLLGVSVFTQRFFEKLYARLKPPFAIVFDNYQEVSEQSPLHELVNIGLSLIPGGIQVFVMSRNEPPMAFMRQRANGGMRSVGWNDLRFTLEESRRVVRLKAKRKPSEGAVEELHRKTEGWAAGLVLLMEGARAEKPGTQASGNNLQPGVFAYFAGEILNKLDPGTREFLLLTSFLPRMTVPAAEKLADQKNAGRILSAFYRNNFFTEKHAAPEPLYQYHSLFREFLQAHVKESHNPADVLRVQKRAAALLEESGHIEDAVLLLLEARDWEQLVRLIRAHAESVAAQGRFRQLETWLSSLPENILGSDPWLLYWLAICEQARSPVEARALFERALTAFRASNNTAGVLWSWSAAVDTYLFDPGELTRLDDWIEKGEELLRVYPEYPSSELEAHMASAMFLALAFRQPHRPEVKIWAERAYGLSLKHRDMMLRIKTIQSATFYFIWTGDFSKAGQMIQEFKGMSGELEKTSPLAFLTLKFLEALCFWHQAENESCRKTVLEALEASQQCGVQVWDCRLQGQMASAALSDGDLAAAKGALERMAQLHEGGGRNDTSYYHHLASWHSLLEDDLPTARAHAESALQLARVSGSPFAEGLNRLLTSHILHESKEREEALLHLVAAQHIGDVMRSSIMEFMCLLARARFAFDEDDEESGILHLRAAMRIGRKNRYMNFDGWLPGVMASLCEAALENGIEIDYVRELVRKRNLFPEAPPEAEHWPWPLEIATLGAFRLTKDGEPVRSSGKVQQKPLVLLKALIALGGKNVREDRLSDLLWPEAEGDAAHSAFSTTLLRLRALLGNEKFIQLQEARLSLDPRYCRIDAWAFERKIDQAGVLWARIGDGENRGREEREKEALRLTEKAVGMYKGHFLHDDLGLVWAVSYRERLRNKFLRNVVRMGSYFEQDRRVEKAAECYQRALDVDDLAEEIYQQLMLCHRQLGWTAEATAVYKRCRAALSAAMGITPSKKTEAIYSSLSR